MTSRVGIFKDEQLGPGLVNRKTRGSTCLILRAFPSESTQEMEGSTKAGLTGGGGHTRCTTLLCARAKCGEHRQKAYNLPVFVSNNL